MNEQAGPFRVADLSDPTIRHLRLEALQKAHRARESLERQVERIERSPAGDRRASGASGASGTFEEDAARLEDIHRNLQHERRVARRPFHRRADRLVVALELAERLALDRRGFADYADYEARGADEPVPDIIDIDRLEEAARELAEAEATLAELDRATAAEPSDEVTDLPVWFVDPVLRASGRTRPTMARRSLFDRTGPGRPDDLTEDGLIAPLLPLRRPPKERADTPRSGDSGGSDGGVLGEIVRDGHTIRIQKAPGLPYADDEDVTGLGPDSITYGDPHRLN